MQALSPIYAQGIQLLRVNFLYCIDQEQNTKHANSVFHLSLKTWGIIWFLFINIVYVIIKKARKKWQKHDSQRKWTAKEEWNKNLPVCNSHLVIKPGEVSVPSKNHPTFLWTSFYQYFVYLCGKIAVSKNVQNFMLHWLQGRNYPLFLNATKLMD